MPGRLQRTDRGPSRYNRFRGRPAIVALLTDCRVAYDPSVARLSYDFWKKAEVIGPAKSSEDCEVLVYGGAVESRSFPAKVRRRIAIGVLDALRDAEGQLATWRTSPIRHLLEEAAAGITRVDQRF